MHSLRFRSAGLTAACLFVTIGLGVAAASYTERERGLARRVLTHAVEGLRDYYFDPTLLPADLNDRASRAQQQIQQADSNSAAFAAIANFLADIDPVYLRLVPPPRTNQPRHDWDWVMLGDAAYVSVVNPGSDAERQGMRAGDRILRIENQIPERGNEGWITYAFLTIAPRATLSVVLQTGNDEPRRIEVTGRTVRTKDDPSGAFYAPPESRTPRGKSTAHRRMHGDVLVWRPLEIDFRDDEMAAALRQLRAARALVLDLRNMEIYSTKETAGVMAALTGNDAVLCTLVDRKKKEDLRQRAHKTPFTGSIVVLTNGGTSRMAEVMAHALREQGRALILGERSAVRLRVGTYYSMFDTQYLQQVEIYGLILPRQRILFGGDIDLEGKGVAPDWQIMPTPADLAAQRDPVLAKAFEILKSPITPEEAAKISRDL